MAASSCRFPLRSSLSARRVLRNLVAFALLYGAGLAAVWGFSLLGVSTLVAFPVFVLGVLIASLETDSGLWGAALGVAYLLSYDFLFTAPLFTLKVLSRTDVAALAIFLVVSLIMGVITHRMSRQVQAAERTACAPGAAESAERRAAGELHPAGGLQLRPGVPDPGAEAAGDHHLGGAAGRGQRGGPRLLRASLAHRLRRAGLAGCDGEVPAARHEGAPVRGGGHRLLLGGCG